MATIASLMVSLVMNSAAFTKGARAAEGSFAKMQKSASAFIGIVGAMGAAVGTVVSYVVYQALYVWDQHRSLSVPSLRTWTLWTSGLVLGVAQLAAGSGIGMRIAWAIVATGTLAAIVRTVKCADGRLLDRLFAGPLDPIGGMIKRVLVAAPHV